MSKSKKEMRRVCEVQRTFMENGKKVKKWVLKSVSEVGKSELIRCPYRQCTIRIHHEGEGLRSLPDHFEHRSLEDEDSKDCPASSG